MPHTTPALAPLSEASRRRLHDLRFFEAVSMQFGYLLTPLLALHLSSSLFLVGASLISDGVARGLSQAVSGSLLARIGHAKVHALNEAIRLLALVVLAACAAGWLPPTVVVLCAFGLQFASSSAITLYAHSITVYWPPQDRVAAHHGQAYRDQAGCVLALLAGLLIATPVILAMAAVAWQVVVAGVLVRWLPRVHPPVKLPGDGRKLHHQVAQDLKACANRQVTQYALAGTLIYAAALVGFATPAFLVHAAGVPVETAGAWLSGALLLKSTLSLMALRLARRQSNTPAGSVKVGRLGHGLFTLGLVGQLVPISPGWTVGATALMGLGATLLTPNLRYLRQSLIQRTTPPNAHAGATGLLSAWDATGFFLAGALLLGDPPLWAVLGSAVGLSVLSAVMLEKSYRWLLLVAPRNTR